jgi:hypothetical protein
MTILQWQMDVYNRLRDGLPNTKVFLEGVPENSSVPMDPVGLAKPMIIIWFGQISRSEAGAAGADLCGVEGGTTVGLMNVAVEAVAPSGLSLLQVEQAVRNLLTGFSPNSQGQLYEGGAATIRDPLPVGIGDGLRFYKPLFFTGQVG